VLRLTEQSHGNACGIGLFDAVTKQAADEMDAEKTVVNAVQTSGRPLFARVNAVVRTTKRCLPGPWAQTTGCKLVRADA